MMINVLTMSLHLMFVLLLLSPLCNGSHFRGGIITWIPTEQDLQIALSYRVSWRRSTHFCDDSTISSGLLNQGVGTLQCTGGCTNTSLPMDYYCTDFSTTEDWTTGTRTLIYNLNPSSTVVFFTYTGCCWIGFVTGNSSGDWAIRAKTNVTKRTDTGKINSSPTTSVSPNVRVLQRCIAIINLLVADRDGDIVRCRWSNTPEECGSICSSLPGADLNEETCTITYQATGNVGYYGVAVRIEDFPSTGSTIPYSSVPVQFLVDVYSANLGCDSLPEFIPPTREDQEVVYINANSVYFDQIVAISSVPNTSIAEITKVSPTGFIKSTLAEYPDIPGSWYVNITWTPTSSVVNTRTILCFTATDKMGLTSQQRCINLIVSFDICDSTGPGFSRCLNGGTCNKINSTHFTCDCQPGITGPDCSVDIDECQSEPCMNHGVCNNTLGNYNCTCPKRFVGKDCEHDRCKQGPADFVFLVDSSISQGNNFKKQLTFVKEFVKSVYIGPLYVQISVITFSFNATVEFSWMTHNDNISVLDAIDKIEYKPGPTYTGAALREARKVLLNSTRIRKYVIVLTDGMSSDISDTRFQAALLNAARVNIVAIGIGSQVLHEELQNIASGYNRVFTISNHDALNNIITKISSYVCEGCFNKVSDVLYVLDASSSVNLSDFQSTLNTLQYITSVLTIGPDKVRVSLIRYEDEPKLVLGFHSSAKEMHREISVLYQYPKPANFTKSVEFVYYNGFAIANGARENTRQVIIFLTNGINIDAEARNRIEILKKENEKIILAIGHGKFVDREKLLDIVSDPYMFYHLGEEQYTDISVLKSLKGLTEYNTCKL